MTQPHNHEAERRRVLERFNTAVAENELTVSGLLAPDEIGPYFDQMANLSHEAYGFDPDKARRWLDSCIVPLGSRAVLLTDTEDQVVGFTLGARAINDPLCQLEVAADVVEELRERFGVEEEDVLYSPALAIAESHRRKGLGAGLALVALQLCRQQPCPNGALLFYRTQPGNPVAEQVRDLGANDTEIVSPGGRTLWYAHIPPLDNGENATSEEDNSTHEL